MFFDVIYQTLIINATKTLSLIQVPFLGLESGFVRHLVGKLFVDMSNLLAVFVRSLRFSRVSSVCQRIVITL